ncbi:MAG: hypothetical protein ABSE22_00560 [Xanthobacteraceae bacterium]|jgi:peptide subunit release factor 1 (eRF1)
MDDREFRNAINSLSENHGRIMTLIEHMPPLTEEQSREIGEALARQRREYDECLKHNAETKNKSELAQEAWKAARQAVREDDAEYPKSSEPGSWRNMWIALAIVGAILLFLKLRFH